MGDRECIHCGKSLEGGCNSPFKPPKTVDIRVEFSQQSTGTTVAEMKRTISDYFQNDRQECTFKITVYLLPSSDVNPIIHQ